MPTAPPPGRFIRMPEIRRETGLSRSTIYRLIEQGRFPKQSRLSAGCTGWWSPQLDAWKAERLAENRQS